MKCKKRHAKDCDCFDEKTDSETLQKMTEFINMVHDCKTWRTRFFVVWFKWKGFE